MADTPSLKACPWCGDMADLNHVPHYYHLGLEKSRALAWRICCVNDDCPVEVYCDFASKTEAITAWNLRAPDPVREAALEVCEDVMAILKARAGFMGVNLTDEEFNLFADAQAALALAGKAP